LKFADKNVSYVSSDHEYLVSSDMAKINTNFYVDHSDMDLMLDHVMQAGVPWTLGSINDGWEWIAFTFHSQSQISLSQEELVQMLAASDKVVQTAYNRMVLSSDQKWAGRTAEEVEFIIHECGLREGEYVIDFGCGSGRHVAALAKRGLSVIGIDYAENHISNANKRNGEENASFRLADCRDVNVGENIADAVICLYDVVGSYADNTENQRILSNLYRHLKPGGFAIVSVMNYTITLASAKNVFSISDSPDVLLTLPSSNTMEKTGNVFDPDYYAVDVENQVVYRKEQFMHGDELPVEMIVRDRRFTRDEIKTMCEQAGFNVLFSRIVKLGNWDAEDMGGKEILVKCQKPYAP
jgi:2-polyprenyl-3-methyl-5-hydroxy-6-metoxy-1,4-benzoquinol methylase